MYSVTGSCTSACTTTALTVGCCSVANCNNALLCYVGAYYSITTFSSSTYTKTVCPLASNSYCSNVYSYSALTGLTVTGSCASTCASSSIISSPAILASGTSCCSTSLCNSYNSLAHTNKFNWSFLLGALFASLYLWSSIEKVRPFSNCFLIAFVMKIQTLKTN